MQKIRYCFSVLAIWLTVLLLITGCEREPPVDHPAEGDAKISVYQSNVVKLDTLIFTNPDTLVGNQIRFDLLGTPPQIKSGDIVYYPGGQGVCGKVISATLIGSRMVFMLDKFTLDQVFKSITIKDSLSKEILKSRVRTDIHSWNSDTLGLDKVYLFNDFWQSKLLQVKVNTGKFFSRTSLGQFQLSGQGSDPWFDRCRLDLNYSLEFAADLVIQTGSAMDVTDSLLVEKSTYGPYLINGFPVTYQIDTWLGFHVVTQRDTTLTIKLSENCKGNISMNYNYWENWKVVRNGQGESADIQLFSGSRYFGYRNEVFVSQVITPYFCGEPSLSLSNRLSGLVNTTVTIPNWQSTQSVSAKGNLIRSGLVFGESVPVQLSTSESLLYSETENAVLENQPPKASFIINPRDGFTDTNFEFNASASSDMETAAESLMVRWDFDGDSHFDTEFSTNKVAIYRYPKPGVYQVSAEVKDAGGLTARSTTSLDVSLSTSAPVANFTVTPASGKISDYFIFNADESYDAEDDKAKLKVRWDFNGDGIWDTDWSTDKIEYHFYKIEGKYIAKLEVLDTQGLSGSTTRMVTVTPVNIKPTAFFTVNPESGTIGTQFNFDASGSTDPEDSTINLRVRWDWENDGTYDTEYRTIKTIQHTFLVAGTYTVVMEVIDTEDYGSTFSRVIHVTNPNTPPDADFTITPEKGKVDSLITFDASISKDAEDSLAQLEVRWDWNNDNIYDTPYTTGKVITRTFSEAGTYIIKMQVRDSGGLTDYRVLTVKIE